MLPQPGTNYPQMTHIYTPTSLCNEYMNLKLPEIPNNDNIISNNSSSHKISGVQLSFRPSEGISKDTTQPISILDRILSSVILEASKGTELVVLQELPLTPYFCQTQDPLYFHTLPIKTLGRNPSDPLSSSFHTWLTSLTTTHNVSLAFSYYESSNGSLYNTLALYSPSRSPVQYRKTHIPDGPGYCEKFYFTPGDTGPVVAELPSGLKVGLSVCWDQWFPEQARSLALLGAHVLIYPTAIGSEPHTGICSSSSSLGQWRRVMQGHAAANMIPVMAVNRAGVERVMGEGGRTSEITFYGSSFATDNTGDIVSSLDKDEEGVVTVEVDTGKVERERISWGMWRDRRPECYGAIKTKDGVTKAPGT